MRDERYYLVFENTNREELLFVLVNWNKFTIDNEDVNPDIPIFIIVREYL